jgi:hypothetical protein
VTILGTDFRNTIEVTFNGAITPFTEISRTEIRAIVPPGATSGLIKVTTRQSAGYSTDPFTVFEEIEVPVVSGTYYVSTSGDDANDGLTPSTPWQTLSKASETTYQPGDTVLFKRGDAFDGTMRVLGVGESANRITFGAYGQGAKPIFWGDNNTRSWVAVNAGIGLYKMNVGSGSVLGEAWDGATKLTQTNDVGVEGANLQPGEIGPRTTVDTWYVRTVAEGPPTNVVVYRKDLFDVSGAKPYITVRDLVWRSATHGSIWEGNNGIVQQCEIYDAFDLGIYVRYCDDTVVEYCQTDRTGNDALYSFQCNRTIFRYNHLENILDTILGFAQTGDQAIIGLEESVDCVVEYNHGYNAIGTAVDYELDARSIVRYNYFRKTRVGAISPHGTGCLVYGNVFHVDKVGGDTGRGVSAGFAAVAGEPDADVEVYENFLLGVDAYGLRGRGGVKNVSFHDNVVEAYGESMDCVDYDTACVSQDNLFVIWGVSTYIWDSVDYATLALFQVASGQETNSREVS